MESEKLRRMMESHNEEGRSSLKMLAYVQVFAGMVIAVAIFIVVVL